MKIYDILLFFNKNKMLWLCIGKTITKFKFKPIKYILLNLFRATSPFFYANDIV